MNTSTATTSTHLAELIPQGATSDCPAYRYAGEGRFLPANDAARLECARWNAYADTMNARTAARSLRRHDH